MSSEPAHQQPPASRAVTSARTKLLVSLGAGIAGVAATPLAGAGGAAPLIGWDILVLVYGAWVWSTVWSVDPASAESDAKREDPSHDLADLMVLGAAIAGTTKRSASALMGPALSVDANTSA